MDAKARNKRIIWLRAAYWTGAIVDAVAFFQMALPNISYKMLTGLDTPSSDYVLAMRLGAALMLAWTILLIWADRKPVERQAIIPMTLLIIVLNAATIITSTVSGLLPFGRVLPNLVLIGLVFILFVTAFIQGHILKKEQAPSGTRTAPGA